MPKVIRDCPELRCRVLLGKNAIFLIESYSGLDRVHIGGGRKPTQVAEKWRALTGEDIRNLLFDTHRAMQQSKHDAKRKRADNLDLLRDVLRAKQATAPDKPAKKAKKAKASAPAADFYASWEWKELRFKALQTYGRRCMCCGWEPSHGYGHLVVDHIKPRSKFPSMELDFCNLQVLCNNCNMGKSNKSQADFRVVSGGKERAPAIANRPEGSK